MRRPAVAVAVLACSTLLLATPPPAQFPQSVICEFERIATAELDATGKIVTGGDTSKGEIVISNLNSDAPVGSGNVGSIKLRVLAKSNDTVWLGETTSTKHETLHTVSGEAPFGFVEIGRFRPLK